MAADEIPGTEDGTKRRYLINPPVFFGSAAIILAVVLFGALAPDAAEATFAQVQRWIVDTFGWLYVLAVAIFLVFVIYLALSAHGDVKLGPDDSEPDFSYPSWFAMLFSAGMGIGLMFFAVAEPVMHFLNPPLGEGGSLDAARDALRITFFHWGIHAWAIYAVVGLALAYFSFRHNLPLTIRSSLYPLIGERIYGPVGHAVDIFAVVGTMFGIATSLGLGVLQINAGINHIFGIPENITSQLILIAAITAFATISVVAGLEGGIRRISEGNLFLAVILMLFVLVSGPTLFLLQALVQNVGAYISSLVDKTFTLYAYEPTDWIGGWTLFYWSWWISWSPFVGMFIARISRGRTIREFVFGVLFVPTGFTFLWMTTFGNTAILFEMTGLVEIGRTVEENLPLALFAFLEGLPLSSVTSVIAATLAVTFFVTSSDSGSLVIDTITSGGHDDAPVWQRIFWATGEGVVAAVLLLAGGLQALQSAAIAGALPFVFVLLAVCYGLGKGLRLDRAKQLSLRLAAPLQAPGAHIPWQRRLATIVTYPGRERALRFMAETVRPALADVCAELCQRQVQAEVEGDDRELALIIHFEGASDFRYNIRLRSLEVPHFAFPEMERKRREKNRYYRAEAWLTQGGRSYDIMGWTREQVISDVLSRYEHHLHGLQTVS